MLIAPTLSAEDFSKIHNGKCELHFAIQALEGVVVQPLIDRLKKAEEQIKAGLAAAYAEEDRIFHLRRKTYEQVAERLGLRHSEWSMFEVENMDEVPYPEATTLKYDGGFGSAQQVSFGAPASWASLWQAADLAIRQSGDTHHTFIESLTLVDGVVVLSTGS